MTEPAGLLWILAQLGPQGEHAEAARRVRAELASPTPRAPRGVLLHALGLALAAPPDAPPDDLAEAVRALEAALLAAPDAPVPRADLVGPIAEPLAACLRRYAATGRASLGTAADDGDALFTRLLQEAQALVGTRQFAAATVLLGRAADSVAPPAPRDATPSTPAAPDLLARDALPVVRAAHTVRRAIDAYLRDLDPPASGRVQRDLLEQAGGVTPAAIARARERFLDERRLTYSAEERDRYVGVLTDFVSAALDARRPELARHILHPTLDVLRGATGRVGPEASLALGYARLAAGAGAPAEAYLVAEAVRRRCEDAGDTHWRAPAEVAVGIARIALGARDEGRQRVRAGLDALPASDHGDTRLDGLRWLYDADLDAFDGDGALACHAALVALGGARGTSRREVEARTAERTDAADAMDRYHALLEDPAERAPGRGVTLDTAWRVVPRLGRLLLDAGHHGAAYQMLDTYYRPLLDARDPDHPAVTELDELLADLEYAVGRPENALACLSRATARDSRLASRQLAVATARQRRALLAGPRRRADAMVALAAECAGDDARAVGGTFAIVTQRKGLNTNLEWQAGRDVARAAVRAPHVAALREQQAALRTAITRAALALAGGTAGGDAHLDALVDEEEALSAELLFLAGGIAVASHAEAPNPFSIAMCLPEHSAYVEYVRCQPPRRPGAAPPPARYAAFVVSARAMDWHLVDLGDAASIDALVAQFRAEVTGEADSVRDVGEEDGDGPPGDGPTSAHAPGVDAPGVDAPGVDAPGGAGDGLTTAGVRLRQRVLDPLLPRLGDRTRLVVAPDGPLWAIPLECLPTDAGGHLVEDYCVSYVSSARSAAVFDADRAPERPTPADGTPNALAPDARAPDAHMPDAHMPDARTPDSLVVGAPDYDLGGAAHAAAPAPARAFGFRFGPLPGTRAEAYEVAAVLGVAPTLGAAATAARVRAVRRPLAVHLATHGFALDASAAGGRLADAPLLRTGLALAGANAPPAAGGDAGVLTADEVASLDLDGTALVVLSACKTGLGDVEQGEGLASLGRSFEAAGARCVVVGLWSVPDAETRELMAAFYGGLASGDGAAAALWRAKQATRRRYPSVRRWGAFVCSGAWGPVALPPGPTAPPPA